MRKQEQQNKKLGGGKKFQFTRMIRHARAGRATDIELRHLAEHGIFIPLRLRNIARLI